MWTVLRHGPRRGPGAPIAPTCIQPLSDPGTHLRRGPAYGQCRSLAIMPEPPSGLLEWAAATHGPWRGRWCGGGWASIPTSSSPPRRHPAQRRHGLVPSFMIDPGYRHGRDQEHDHDDYCDHSSMRHPCGCRPSDGQRLGQVHYPLPRHVAPQASLPASARPRHSQPAGVLLMGNASFGTPGHHGPAVARGATAPRISHHAPLRRRLTPIRPPEAAPSPMTPGPDPS